MSYKELGKITEAEKKRRVYDLHDAVAIAYPSAGRHLEGKVHIMPIPRAGVALGLGVHVEGRTALLALREAAELALGDVSAAPPANEGCGKP